MTQNQINYWQLQEQIMADRNREAENMRTNIANELIKAKANEITERLGLGNLNELITSHRNVERETNRHNIATESLESVKRAIEQYVADTGRLNIGLGYAQLNELMRSNLENEAIKRTTNTNTFLRDRENYDIAKRQLNETSQHNRNVEEENKRNNLTSQLLSAYRLLNDINLGTANVGVNAMSNLMQPVNQAIRGRGGSSYVQ